MIIHSLKAENLLKYRRLELSDLPEQGLIAVDGYNESGKSSIGESICFALFGRSFAVGSGALEKLIRWGETSCSVSLELSVGDGIRYRVYRSLDIDGNQAARLCRDENPDPPIARGMEAVNQALEALLGFNFEVFIDSFYLAQREITAPHPHSHSVKIMAGLEPLERCRAQMQQELARDKEIVEESLQRIQEMEQAMGEVDFAPERLTALEQMRDAAAGLVAGSRRCREALNSVAADFRERSLRLLRTRRGRANARRLGLLFLVLAAILLGGWELLTRMPDSFAGVTLSKLLAESIDGWQTDHAVWLLYGGAVSAALMLLLWIRSFALGRRIRQQQKNDRQQREELKPLDSMESLLDQEIPGQVADEQGGAGDFRQRPSPQLRMEILDRIAAGSAEADEVFDLVGKENWWLDQALERMSGRILELEAAIAAQQQARDEHGRLSAERAELERKVQQHRHLLQVRELADGLLLGAARQVSHRFNYNLRGQVSRTLPLFTEGRYEHLQIDDNLSVQAFSADKRGFMDLSEISSGTQRQIMLALRIALSQELIKRAVNTRQFLFLDEPFAFFDQARTRSSLEVLPRLSDDLTQIWVIAQQFPEDIEFQRRIQCERGSDNCVSGSEPVEKN